MVLSILHRKDAKAARKRWRASQVSPKKFLFRETDRALTLISWKFCCFKVRLEIWLTILMEALSTKNGLVKRFVMKPLEFKVSGPKECANSPAICPISFNLNRFPDYLNGSKWLQMMASNFKMWSALRSTPVVLHLFAINLPLVMAMRALNRSEHFCLGRLHRTASLVSERETTTWAARLPAELEAVAHLRC